ncbi:MAG: hypothetical protein HQ481_00015 [Alphaproteobacteria bacterium]|nr:hypothetical protein [Alphaproteobacteria bacterium]
MTDFWLSSGFELLECDDTGRLRFTPEYMRAYWRRPEVAPIAESCDAERTLHATLLHAPLRPVEDAELTALADPDAIENYRAVLRFRAFLQRFETVEAAYLHVARQGGIDFPPVFVDHLVHAILRAALGGTNDPFRVRAGELFFRSQRVTIENERIMVADQAMVDMQARSGKTGLSSSIIPGSVDIEVLTEDVKQEYWGRSDSFDTAVDIAYTQPGLHGLARAIEAWITHLLGLAVRVQPMRKIEDERWVWHVGLDRDANDILNDLYKGNPVEEDRLRQIVALFQMEIEDTATVLDHVTGRPIYLGLAMAPDGVVRMKPQNLIANLPLKAAS